jgi:hypothetical protein
MNEDIYWAMLIQFQCAVSHLYEILLATSRIVLNCSSHIPSSDPQCLSYLSFYQSLPALRE